jgi:hypothetical protein
VYSRVYFHMKSVKEFFDSLTETGLDLCVDLGTRSKNSSGEYDIVSF